MRIDIERKATGFGFHYAVLLNGQAFCQVTASRTIWPFLRNAFVKTLDGSSLATIGQTSLWYRVLEKIPYFFGSPFAIRRGGSELARLRGWPNLKQYEARGNWGVSELRIYGHEGTTYSVFRGDEQIGLIDREARSVSDGGTYHADFDHDLDPLLCACLVLFVDLAWHMDDNLQFSSTRYEWNQQLGGVARNPEWRPKGESDSPGGKLLTPGLVSTSGADSATYNRYAKWMGWLFATLSTGLLITCLAIYLFTRHFAAAACRGDGTVTQLLREPGDRHGAAYRAVFKFRDANQMMHEITSHFASNPPKFQAGDKVRVLYLPNDPETAVIDDFDELWFGAGLFGVVGAVFAAVATVILRTAYSQKVSPASPNVPKIE
jgi:hypothetical protein